ncbi:hypothetical protein BDE36_0718 [Arcticibacter tournemirensis]|uniref:PKD domain-containing protein n=1 Tax=Arcticibacter tournemirensis TaxID=699437 RepID=A0A5M9H8C8_9SPHI|nr:hypothetical protein [Arcticibacter tournemirensis]KAA8481438.1 hypothetical protein F1649_15100 [Arcticibacter tournemirensis]TQM49026.1 hypothetical protein BDE36_0718 [Arcticibacter tournemirensis]
MKRSIKLFSILLGISLFLITCRKEEYNLERALDKSEIKYSIVQDKSADAGGNTVILKNETAGTISMWDFGTGRSTNAVDTVHFAFKGDYTIKFAVLTGGSIVELDPVTIKVTEDNLNYVNDPLWTAISGGVGQEKVWLLDTDAKFFNGPLTFFGVNNGWLKEGNPWNGGANSTGCYGADCWTWGPDLTTIYADKMTKTDYGTMTFSLKGGAIFTADKKFEKVTQTGTYYLNSAGKTLSITNGSILRDYKPAKNGLRGISNWSNYTILSLDENTMQLGVIRDKDVDGEGLCMLSYNFISKQYSDNWVPEETGPDEGFDPTFASGKLLEMLTGNTSSGRMWALDAAGNPVDWIAKGKGWTKTAADSKTWGWNDDWDAIAKNSWILFDRLNGGMNYTLNQNGSFTRGIFSINQETNEITLNGGTLIQNPGHWMSPTTNKIKVIKAFPGKVESKGIWFGTSYDAAKDEWLAFHYIL